MRNVKHILSICVRKHKNSEADIYVRKNKNSEAESKKVRHKQNKVM